MAAADPVQGRGAPWTRILLGLGVLLAFVVDLGTRRSFIAALGYVAVVVIASRVSSLRDSLSVALCCSALAVSRLLAAAAVSGASRELAHRVLLLLAIWTAVVFVFQRRKASQGSDVADRPEDDSLPGCAFQASHNVCVIATDASRTIIDANEAAGSLLGYETGELPGCDLGQVLPASQAASYRLSTRSGADEIEDVSDSSGEIEVLRKSGQKLRMRYRLCRSHETNKPLRILLSPTRQTLERSRTSEQGPSPASPAPDTDFIAPLDQKFVPCPPGQRLLCRAYYDMLTGLPNREYFMKRLARAFSRSKRDQRLGFAVLFMDLDRFKIINDSLGHDLGDELLRQVSQRLLRCTRPCDTAARLGGDEFVLLLDGARTLPDPIAVAERIQHEMREVFSLRGHEVYATASIGIAMSSWSRDRYEPILRDADAAMYRAKACGRARFQVYDAAMQESAMARLLLETELRHATENLAESFRAFYQPVVSLTDGTLSGFEALLRWNHPRRGTLHPRDFIAAAEDTGLIVPIGWWMLQQACRQLGEWRDRYPDLPLPFMSVNLSRRQIGQPELLREVRTAVRDNRLGPGWLRLEISEKAVGDLAAATSDRLGKLSQNDVPLQLDDFGTGHAALAYLHRLPLHAVKVDCSLFSSDRHASRRAAIVRNIVNLIHLLDVSAIAEGVETPDLAAQLRTSLCQHAQGFYFSEPLEAAAAGRIIAKRPRW